jgi:hypothetical protein
VKKEHEPDFGWLSDRSVVSQPKPRQRRIGFTWKSSVGRIGSVRCRSDKQLSLPFETATIIPFPLGSKRVH